MDTANINLGAENARQILAVDPGAGAEALRLAFRRAVKAAHPDRPGGDSERLRRVIEAYQILRLSSVAHEPPPRPAAPPRARTRRLIITPADAMIGGWRAVRMDGGAMARLHLPVGLRDGEPMSVDGRTLTVSIVGGEEATVLGDHLCLTAHVEPGLLIRGGRLIVDTPSGPRSHWITGQDGQRGLVRVAGQGLPARAGFPRGCLFIRLVARPEARVETGVREKLRRFTAAWAA